MDNAEQFRILLDSITDYAIFLLDSQGCVSSWSTAAEKMFGYSSNDIQGKHFSCLYPPADVDSQKPREEIQMAAVHGRFEDISWRKRRDGTLFWADSVLCPLRMENGQLRGFSQVIRDITERKKSDDRLRQIEEELLQARKMEAIGRLAGGVAHDFNNFMTGIVGLTEDICQSMERTDPRRSDLEDVIKTAQRAQTLTRELLAFGRRQISSPKVLNINDVIAEKQNFLQQLLGTDIDFKTDFDPTIGNILMDSTQLDQVLVNLLANSRDAMPQGGRLKIQTRRFQVAKGVTSAVQEGAYVAITISDTGHGIDQKIVPHLFEPFFTTKQKGEGTGLGLATVYGIIKQNHGDISLDTQSTQGTTFRILLPEIDAPVTIEPTRLAETEAPGSETILLAEDEDVVRRVVTSALAKNGYQVLGTSSGTQALDLARTYSKPIHLLLTDVAMPGMNGPTLAKQILALHPETAVLFMSGYAEDLIQERGVLESGIHFIEKSFTRDTLVRKVSEVLRTHRSVNSPP